MEDEEGYMALSFKSRKEYGKYNLTSQIQGTEGRESLASIRRLLPRYYGSSGGLVLATKVVQWVYIAVWTFCLWGYHVYRRKDTLLPLDTLPRNSRCHQLGVGVGCTMIVLLIGAVVVLATWAFQMRHPTDVPEKTSISQKLKNGTTMENMPSLENFVSHLRQFLCKPLDNKETENSSCRLCPQNWSLHENKCYWVSKERQTWHKGKEDCTAKLSRMLVIHNQEEVTFIQKITEGAQLLWIGLEASFPERKWTWIDGSPLDDKLFQDLDPVEANYCGRLNGNQIISEVCSTIAIWICETNALLI